jgi:hypothetical protein
VKTKLKSKMSDSMRISGVGIYKIVVCMYGTIYQLRLSPTISKLKNLLDALFDREMCDVNKFRKGDEDDFFICVI